jgi:hypothetical protein
MAGEGTQYISVAAAAKILRVTPQRVYQLLESGALAGRWSGATRLVGVASVNTRVEILRESKHPRLEI